MPTVSIHLDPDNEYGVTLHHPAKAIDFCDQLTSQYDVREQVEYEGLTIDDATVDRISRAGTLAYWANSGQISEAILRQFADTLGYPLTKI